MRQLSVGRVLTILQKISIDPLEKRPAASRQRGRFLPERVVQANITVIEHTLESLAIFFNGLFTTEVQIARFF